MKTASEWNVANRVAKHRRNLAEAKRKEAQVTKSLALPPVLPESVGVFASLVRCRLTWIEKCSRPKSRNLLHRVFLGEFIRTYAKALESNPHAIATSMAGKLATVGFPIETFHLTDAKRFRDRETRNHRPTIEARFSALCVDNFVPQTPANAEESAYLQGLFSLAENQVIDALWEALSYDFPRFLRQKGAAARHAIYGGQWRGSDRGKPGGGSERPGTEA